MQHNFDLIIIGGGPSGINCGISAHRAEINYCILEQGVLANSIYNFPSQMTFFSTSLKLEIGDIPFISHTDKPTRKEALEYYRRIIQTYDMNLHYATCVNGMKSDSCGTYTIATSKGNYTAKSVIVATGFYGLPRLLDIPGESMPKVKHYYDEAHPYIGRDIIIIGGANSACDVALETYQKGANVTMVVRKPELTDRVKYWILPNIKNRIEEGSIKCYFSSTVTKIKEESVTIQTPDGRIQLKNDFVLAMTGYTPDYKLLKSLNIKIDTDEYQTPIYNEETFESSLPNVYLTGVVNGGLKTNRFFIENTRHQADVIVERIKNFESS